VRAASFEFGNEQSFSWTARRKLTRRRAVDLAPNRLLRNLFHNSEEKHELIEQCLALRRLSEQLLPQLGADDARDLEIKSNLPTPPSALLEDSRHDTR
jgi:hypothetical protein